MAPKKQALQQQQQRSQADGDGAISAAATSELWTIVLGSTGGASLLSFADVAVLARVCHGCFAATAAAKTKAQWAVARFGARTALAALYAQQPRLLTAAVVDALVAAGASLPRALVLLLVREKRAHQRYAKALDAHFKYQKDVKRQLEWRAMELEAQRLTNASKSETRALIDKSKASASKRDIHDLQMSEVEDDQNAPNNDTNTVLNDYADDAEDADEENNKTSIALVPLPSYAEIPHVPHPEAVQSTNSAFLKPGVRDYIIEVGEDIYGKVFFSSNAPLAYSERISLLPEELHWTANITQVVGLASPAGEWPFDDTAMFTFLIKYGLDVKSFLTTDAPKEVALIPTPENASDDGKSQSSNTRPSASVGYAVHRNQEAWRRICESIWVLIQKHGFVPEFVLGSILGPLKTFLRNGVALDASNVEEGSWILSEILHHDERLGRLLAKSAGIEGDVVENELYYWILIDSKVQQPPRRHAPLTAAEELHMRQTLAKLPLPIPVVPLRRFLSAHASRHSIQRICEYTSTPLETLKTIGEDLIASLVSPSTLSNNSNPGATLNKVDVLVEAFQISPDALLAHFTIPDYEMYTSAEAKVKPVTAAPAAADDLMDLMSAYAPVGPQLLTRVGALTGSLPWSFWNYLVTRYTSTPAWKSSAAAQQVLSILLHDLTVRRASSNDDDPARRWFGEKEADKALSLFLKALDGSDVVVFKATIVEVCKRVYESAEKGYNDVASRFIHVMEKVEKIVLGAAGPRQIPEPAEGEENAAPNPWKEAVAKPAVLKEWIKVLRSNVVDNAAWKQVITDTTEEVVEDSVVASPETKFYWAVVNLVEDAANLTVPAHTQFGIWARELTLADQTLAKSSLAPEVISGRSASQEPGRIASVLSTINAKTQELGTAISTSQTLKSLSTNTAQLGTSISSNTAQISTNIANSKVIENLSTGAQRLSSSARDLGTAIAASTYVEKASAGASKLGSAIASSTYVEKASTEATRLGTAISSNPYVEQASTGAQKLGTQVAEGAAKVSENLNVGVQVLQTKSKEIVSAVQAKMAAAPAAPVITEEMAAEHRKTIGPVSTITDGGDAVEKQKQAWDKTWDRLSSRLSTAKK